jgi:hypothetical protein
VKCREHGWWRLALVLCALPLTAAGQGGQLRWRAPAGCPTEDAVARALADVPGAAGLDIVGTVSSDGPGYRLQLRVHGQGQSFERELTADSCGVLAESCVWLVQLAITQLSAAKEATRATVPVPAPPPPEITHRAAADADGGNASAALHVLLGLSAAVADIGLSGVSPHLALDGALQRAGWSVGLRLGVLLHPRLDVAGSAEVALHTYAAQLLGCRRWDVSVLALGPCVTVSALHTVARTRGLTGSESSAGTWLAAGPALSVQLRLVRALLLAAEVGAWATLSPRPSFEVSGRAPAQAETLAGYARLGIAYEIW